MDTNTEMTIEERIEKLENQSYASYITYLMQSSLIKLLNEKKIIDVDELAKEMDELAKEMDELNDKLAKEATAASEEPPVESADIPEGN